MEDRVLGMALTGGLRPQADVAETAQRIVAMTGVRTPIQRALGRVRRSTALRSSPVAARAEDALLEALTLIER